MKHFTGVGDAKMPSPVPQAVFPTSESKSTLAAGQGKPSQSPFQTSHQVPTHEHIHMGFAPPPPIQVA